MRPYYVMAAALGLMLLAGAYLLGCPKSPLAKKPADMAKYATLADLDRLKEEGIGHFVGLKDEMAGRADDAIAESERRSHALRKAMADELRREMRSAVLLGGQNITSERTVRRKEIDHLSAETGSAVALLVATDARLAIRLNQLEERLAKANGRIAVLDKLWLEHRCPAPTPAPQAQARPQGPGCPSNLYTIPYPQSYGLPRCR